MSLTSDTDVHLVKNYITCLEELVEQGSAHEIDQESIQRLLTLAVTLYGQQFEQGESFPPTVLGKEITPTHAVVVVSEILKDVNLQLFEVAMWRPGV